MNTLHELELWLEEYRSNKSNRFMRDPEYRKVYGNYAELKREQWLNVLNAHNTFHIVNEELELNYIITPSFYDKFYQVTTFDETMEPLHHITYNTLDEVINENHFFFRTNTVLKEAI